MTYETLRYLTPEDWEAILGITRHRAYGTGDFVIKEGSSIRSIFILRQGYVRVECEYEGQGIALTQLGPGDIFGEMSLLEQTGASASVIAASAVEVDILEELPLRSILNSLPGFPARFYQSLAVTLSQRLRVVSERLSQKDHQGHRAIRTGNISNRQLPRALVAAVEQFKIVMGQIEQQVQRRQLAPDQAQGQTHTACNQLMAVLRQQSEGDVPLDSAWSNLLAFRDLDQVETGFGDYVFRAVYPLMMQSTAISLAYGRPRGIVDDYEVNHHIYLNESEGDGWLGAAIDGWFLSTTFCQSRRVMRQQLARILEHYGQPQDNTPVQITSLASGTAYEVLDVLPHQLHLHITLIDRDLMALGLTGQAAVRQGCAQRLTLIQNDILLLADGQETLKLSPQQMIYSFGLCDALTDQEVLQMIQWAASQLSDQGVIVLTNISAHHPDRLLLEHILDWHPHYRTSAELQALMQSAALTPTDLNECLGDVNSSPGIHWIAGLKSG